MGDRKSRVYHTCVAARYNHVSNNDYYYYYQFYDYYCYYCYCCY